MEQRMRHTTSGGVGLSSLARAKPVIVRGRTKRLENGRAVASRDRLHDADVESGERGIFKRASGHAIPHKIHSTGPNMPRRFRPSVFRAGDTSQVSIMRQAVGYSHDSHRTLERV